MSTQAPTLDPLEPRLAALRRMAPTRLGPEVLAIFEHTIQQALRSGLGAGAPQPGQPAPDLALTDAAGRPLSLAALRAEPGVTGVVVSFFRGDWCLYCGEALAALAVAHDSLRAAGGRVVAVSPQRPEISAAQAERLALPFPLLHDPGCGTADAWGIAHGLDETMRRLFVELGRDLAQWNGDTRWLLPLPATFIIGRDGRVAWRFVHGDYSRRAEPADILAALRRLPPPG